jgi:flavodoxin
MNALVIYESMYGNTERVARAIATGLGDQAAVSVRDMRDVETLPEGIDLLVIGGPTYAHGVEAGMKAFLARLTPSALDGQDVATFDTRLNWPRFLSGAASSGIAQALERKGAHVVIQPASFTVEDRDGPLLDGEEARATAWGRSSPAGRRTGCCPSPHP